MAVSRLQSEPNIPSTVAVEKVVGHVTTTFGTRPMALCSPWCAMSVVGLLVEKDAGSGGSGGGRGERPQVQLATNFPESNKMTITNLPSYVSFYLGQGILNTRPDRGN
ncbi:hypothetical protein V8G54_034865 [Vigna mungo]|uniref:Uncharacterized protein n=1 Tax=Vigna mungo TaxID=3915 RepID=A0AAQ3RCB6_VIGMU